MKLPDNPSQLVLDHSYGYIYKLTNVLTDFVYIGKHRHIKGEHWRDYLGSGFRIRDEQAFLGRDFFKKELVCWTRNDDDATAKELTHIAAVVQSGVPHFNISNEDGALFATTPEQVAAMSSLRLSFEGWKQLNDHRSALTRIVREDPTHRDAAAVQLATVRTAINLKQQREALKRDITAGLITAPIYRKRRSPRFRTY